MISAGPSLAWVGARTGLLDVATQDGQRDVAVGDGAVALIRAIDDDDVRAVRERQRDVVLRAADRCEWCQHCVATQELAAHLQAEDEMRGRVLLHDYKLQGARVRRVVVRLGVVVEGDAV